MARQIQLKYINGELRARVGGQFRSVSSGNASPATIRKRYVIRNGVNGIVSGTVDDAQAAVNLSAIQAIVDQADEEGAAVEMDQETIEIFGGPVIVRSSANGLIWDSPTFARLTQRSDNVPILQIGDTSTICQNLDFSGINLHYLNDQPIENTNANACVIYNQWKTRIGKIQVANTITTARPYRGIYLPQSQSVFSCHFHNLFSFQARYSLLHISNFGTGSVWENIYLSGVGPSGNAQDVSSPFRVDMGGSQMHDGSWTQLNLEWCITNQLMRFSNYRGPAIQSLHIEGNQLSGAGASFIYNSISNVQIDALTMLDNRIQDANVTDAIPALFKYFNNGRTNVDTFFGIQNNSTYIDMPFYLHFQADNDGIHTNPGRTTIRNYQFIDGTGTTVRDNLRVDRTLGGTDMNGGAWGTLYLQGAEEISTGGPITKLVGADQRIDATKTVYGQENIDGTIVIPGNLAADVTLTLSDRMGPPNSRWANLPVPVGTVRSICRGGTTTNASAVNNHDGTQIFSIAGGAATSRRNVMMNAAGDWVEA